MTDSYREDFDSREIEEEIYTPDKKLSQVCQESNSTAKDNKPMTKCEIMDKNEYIDPEQDETLAKFKRNKTKTIEDGIKLKRGEAEALHPHKGK